MTPQSQPREKRNSSKVNLFISFIVHAIVVAALFYFAARQGLLGKQLKKIAVEMVREKQPEKKEPEKPKAEQAKVSQPKVETPKAEAPKEAPPEASQPTVAPPTAELPSFVFEGGKEVETSSNPVQIYKGLIEYAFRSKWDRPENIADDNFVAEVEVAVSRDGQISNPTWKKGSGDSRWDESVSRAIAAVTNMDRPPPTNFPPRVLIRFDVKQETEPVFQ